MCIVYCLESCSLISKEVNLDTSSIPQQFGADVTFSFYYQPDDATVICAMSQPAEQSFHIFTKLIDNIPVDLTHREVEDAMEMRSFIPLVLPESSDTSDEEV